MGCSASKTLPEAVDEYIVTHDSLDFVIAPVLMQRTGISNIDDFYATAAQPIEALLNATGRVHVHCAVLRQLLAEVNSGYSAKVDMVPSHYILSVDWQLPPYQHDAQHAQRAELLSAKLQDGELQSTHAQLEQHAQDILAHVASYPLGAIKLTATTKGTLAYETSASLGELKAAVQAFNQCLKQLRARTEGLCMLHLSAVPRSREATGTQMARVWIAPSAATQPDVTVTGAGGTDVAATATPDAEVVPAMVAGITDISHTDVASPPSFPCCCPIDIRLAAAPNALPIVTLLQSLQLLLLKMHQAAPNPAAAAVLAADPAVPVLLLQTSSDSQPSGADISKPSNDGSRAPLEGSSRPIDAAVAAEPQQRDADEDAGATIPDGMEEALIPPPPPPTSTPNAQQLQELALANKVLFRLVSECARINGNAASIAQAVMSIATVVQQQRRLRWTPDDLTEDAAELVCSCPLSEDLSIRFTLELQTGGGLPGGSLIKYLPDEGRQLYAALEGIRDEACALAKKLPELRQQFEERFTAAAEVIHQVPEEANNAGMDLTQGLAAARKAGANMRQLSHGRDLFSDVGDKLQELAAEFRAAAAALQEWKGRQGLMAQVHEQQLKQKESLTERTETTETGENAALLQSA